MGRIVRRECPNRDCRSDDSDVLLTSRWYEDEKKRLAVRCRRCGTTGPSKGEDDCAGDVMDAAASAWNGLPRGFDDDVEAYKVVQ